MDYYLETPPRVRAAAGAGRRCRTCGLAFVCSGLGRIPLIGAIGSIWRGWGARNPAPVQGLKHWHDAGWVGDAGRTEGEQCPLLWCAW